MGGLAPGTLPVSGTPRAAAPRPPLGTPGLGTPGLGLCTGTVAVLTGTTLGWGLGPDSWREVASLGTARPEETVLVSERDTELGEGKGQDTLSVCYCSFCHIILEIDNCS